MCRRDRVFQQLFLSAKNQEGMRLCCPFLLGALGVEEGIKPCAGEIGFSNGCFFLRKIKKI